MRHLQIMKCSDRPKGAFLFSNGVLWAAKGEKGSAAVWMQSADFRNEDLDRAYELLQGAVGSPLGVKLVGCSRLIREVAHWCQGKNLPILNQAVREGVFEARFSGEECKILVTKKTRLLLVDAASVLLSALEKAFTADPTIELVGVTDCAEAAVRFMSQKKPEVVVLGLALPGKGGLAFLREYLPHHLIPTIVLSTNRAEDGPQVLQALESGAVDHMVLTSEAEASGGMAHFGEKVRAAAAARVVLPSASGGRAAAPAREELDHSTVVAIGSSTGGTEALRILLTQLPADIPPMLITQHIPGTFSKAFAERMNTLCPFQVCEAVDGMEVLPGNVYIAPGGFQMKIRKKGRKIVIEVNDSEPVNRHKPSVDYLFQSVAQVCGSKSIGVILTGMGADGAEGLLLMRKAGARTIAQDETTCAVFGMPREAIERGAAQEVLGLPEIPEKLIQWLSHRRKAA